MQKVLRVCRANGDDPYAQRHHFWKHSAFHQSISTPFKVTEPPTTLRKAIHSSRYG
jgi:hypothetical protein